ncbi:MAG: o-succinylbenzoate--CoA ligase [Dermatophilaceae bacterium]
MSPHEWTYEEVCDALAFSSADDVIVQVGTSGSTGTPKIARLTARALRASANSTLEVLGGPGQWLLATPATHIAGIQVLVRSALAGIRPVTMAPGGFSPARFAAAVGESAHARRYTALVPAQVSRLLDDEQGRTALARFDAVLVGGAAVPETLRARARAAGTHLVATYGMSETAGGCVYDGRPLPVTRMRIAEPDEHGVGIVEFSGATLAMGYADRPYQSGTAFRTEPDGTRWFRTDDLGRIDDGVLTVLGRRDDVINTGGLKVAPHLVEDAVARALPALATRCVVVASPDPRWGEAVTLVVAVDVPPSLEEVRSMLRPLLPATALPTRVERIDAIPLLGPGKPDRRTVRERISRCGPRDQTDL